MGPTGHELGLHTQTTLPSHTQLGLHTDSSAFTHTTRPSHRQLGLNTHTDNSAFTQTTRPSYRLLSLHTDNSAFTQTTWPLHRQLGLHIDNSAFTQTTRPSHRQLQRTFCLKNRSAPHNSNSPHNNNHPEYWMHSYRCYPARQCASGPNDSKQPGQVRSLWLVGQCAGLPPVPLLATTRRRTVLHFRDNACAHSSFPVSSSCAQHAP